MYKKQLGKPPNHESHLQYLRYRNTLNTIRRKAKKDYYLNILNEFRNDIRKTWGVLNSLIGKTNDKTSLTDSFDINGDTVTNKQTIADAFCKQFANVGAKYANKINKSNYTFNRYMINRNPNSIFFTPTDEYEVQQIISNLKKKRSSGHDNISSHLLKQLQFSLKAPLTTLINKSMTEGIMPDKLKVAKVIPLYKAKERDNMENYRPISILPAMSKVYEKIIFKRIYSFLDKDNILHDSQYGFRPNRCTIDAILDLHEQVQEAFDKKQYSIGLFFDLSKAFDTLDHQILIKKLEWYGIRGKALKWIQNYLTNRYLYVDYGGVESHLTPLTHGVPQGSVLGPLFFILYINDLPNALLNGKAILFADDTTLLKSASDLKELFQDMNSDANELYEWFNVNKLSLNISKTHYIVFCKQNISRENSLKLKIGMTTLQEKKTTKFLGMLIDSKLDWHSHINNVRSKISKSLYGLNCVKHILPRKHLLTLYYSMVHPFIEYGLLMWGGTHKTYIHQIAVMQKKAIRAINKLSYNEHTNEYFLDMKILKVYELYHMQIAKYFYRLEHGGLSASLTQKLKLNRRIIHPYNTRNPFKSYTMNKKIKSIGWSVWHDIPADIKNCTSMKTFKQKIKKTAFG